MLNLGKVQIGTISSVAALMMLDCGDKTGDGSGNSSSAARRRVFIWDADDTLVTTADGAGPRSATVEPASTLRSMQDELCRTSGSTEHFILTHGTVDDLFDTQIKGTLSFLAPMFAATPAVAPRFRSITIATDEQQRESSSSRCIALDAELPIYGLSLSPTLAIPPSGRSLFLSAAGTHGATSKLHVVEGFATSGHWDDVIFIENSLDQLGLVIPAGLRSSSAYAAACRRLCECEGDDDEGGDDQVFDVGRDCGVFSASLALMALRLDAVSQTTSCANVSAFNIHLSGRSRPHCFLPNLTPCRDEDFDCIFSAATRFATAAKRRLSMSPVPLSPSSPCRIDSQRFCAIWAVQVLQPLAEVVTMIESGADATSDGRTAVKSAASQLLWSLYLGGGGQGTPALPLLWSGFGFLAVALFNVCTAPGRIPLDRAVVDALVAAKAHAEHLQFDFLQ